MISICVRLPDGSFQRLEIVATDCMTDIRAKVQPFWNEKTDRMRIVVDGRVMQEGVSANFYKIETDTVIFMVPEKRKQPEKQKPTQLIDELCEKLFKLLFSPTPTQKHLTYDVSEVLKNPVMQSFARINQDAARLMEEAVYILDNFREPISAGMSAFVTRTNDLVATRLEQTKDGMLLLQEFYENDKNRHRISPRQTTNTCYTPAISTNELPDLASTGVTAFKKAYVRRRGSSSNCIQLRRSFHTRLMRVLKGRLVGAIDVGDDDAIVQAINEADGNISKATMILQNRFVT